MKGIFHSFRDPSAFILLVLVMLAFLGAWQFAKEAPGIDYYVAWVASDAVKNETKHDIYDPASGFKLAYEYRNRADALDHAPHQKLLAQRRSNLHMTATPFLYWVTGVFSTGNYDNDVSTWHLLSLLSLLIFFLVIYRLLEFQPTTCLAILLPVVVWYAPLHSDLNVGNVNGFQLGLIGLLMWLQSRDSDRRFLFIAGLVTGLTVMFKPNLAPIGLLLAGGWLVRQQYSKLFTGLFGMTAGVIGAALVSSWWMGSMTSWLDWLQVISKTVEHGPGKGSGNYAVMTQLGGGLSPLYQLLLATALCVVVLIFLWWGHRGRTDTNSDNSFGSSESLENTLLIAMGCVIAMLASALVWIHYYLLTIPMLMVALRPWQDIRHKKLPAIIMQRLLPVVGLICLMDLSLYNLLGIDRLDYWAKATTTCVLILFTVGLWEFRFGIPTQIAGKKSAG